MPNHPSLRIWFEENEAMLAAGAACGLRAAGVL